MRIRKQGLRRGQHHGRAKLTDHEVELLRRMFDSGEWSFRRLAIKFEISAMQVYRIVHYRQR